LIFFPAGCQWRLPIAVSYAGGVIMAELAHDSAQTQRLLEQARAGSAGAISRLLERHRSYLCRFVQLRLDPQLRARFDPSDVVQEAQLEAARRLDGYLGGAPMPFRLWLRQLAQDRLLMLHRRHRGAGRRAVTREAALPSESSLAFGRQLLASGPSPSGRLAASELAHLVQRAVAQLPPADQEIVLLRNFEGLSNQEVAQLLAMQPATASQRYGRALLRLRKLLDEAAPEEHP
jgi:RNA polymerase sigma-70 factor (ECF subfamily)